MVVVVGVWQGDGQGYDDGEDDDDGADDEGADDEADAGGGGDM